MVRIAAKLSIAVCLVVVLFTFAAAGINSFFVERYYLYTKKNQLNTVYSKLTVDKLDDIDRRIKDIEEADDVIIVYAQKTDNIDTLNEKLRDGFLRRRISLVKFWLWDKEYSRLEITGQLNKIYNQGMYRYSLLVKYVLSGDLVFAAGMIIPHIEEAIVIINIFTLMIFCVALLLIVFCIVFFIRKIIKPLSLIEGVADEISRQHFMRLDLHTGDELDNLVASVNRMSTNLESAHRELESKNRSMKNLLTNVSHELKTPVSIVKAYTAGLRDGLDDGTFLDVIESQNERMHVLIEKLLELSRIEGRDIFPKIIDPAVCLNEALGSMKVLFDERGLILDLHVVSGLHIYADAESLKTIYSNLIGNAAAYALGGCVSISLDDSAGYVRFSIRNVVLHAESCTDPEIWRPFYTGSESQNKRIAGTGLGLPIVRALCDKQGFAVDVSVNNEDSGDIVEFSVLFPSVN